MPMMDDSDSSALSSAPEEEVQKLAPIFMKAKKATKKAFPPPPPSPPRPKRDPSPPHEEVLADNPDIAFIVMFRSRFAEAFSSKLSNFGPQDIERGVVDTVPTPQVENLLCALLGLVLNRKKPVERGHHGRALEEAVATNKSQWPLKWAGVNPLHGPKDFNSMIPTERLNLLRTLVMWSLTSSEAIQTMIKDRYKQNRHNDDENQPLSVQPWGIDGDKRRYFLIQGLDDTGFRVYREGSRYTKNAHWYSMAGEIDEAKALATKLEEVDTSQAARRLAAKINNAVPTFEATEEKRRRREYRQIRRAAFSRPEPGFSMYEGRTRGKRMRYNYDDDDQFLEEDSDATSNRRSARQSSRTTPFDSGPEYTASGRQIKRPRTGDYGEGLLSHDDVTREGSEDSDLPTGRASRAVGRSSLRKSRNIDDYNDADNSDEDDAGEDEWDSDKNDGDESMVDADEEQDREASENGDDEDEEDASMIIKLKVSPKNLSSYKNEQSSETGVSSLKLEESKPEAEKTNGDTAAPPAATEAMDIDQPKAEPVLQNGYTAALAPAAVPAPVTTQPQLSTPPPGSSAYPTPASTSFPAQSASAAMPPTAQPEEVKPSAPASIAPPSTTDAETKPLEPTTTAPPAVAAHDSVHNASQ